MNECEWSEQITRLEDAINIIKKYEEVINDSKENIQLFFKQGLI